MVCPLANNPVARVADIRHLVLEDIITTRRISILIEHHSSSRASCLAETVINKLPFFYLANIWVRGDEKFKVMLDPTNPHQHIVAEKTPTHCWMQLMFAFFSCATKWKLSAGCALVKVVLLADGSFSTVCSSALTWLNVPLSSLQAVI